MMDADIISFIRQEIKKQMNIILSGATAATSTTTEDIQELFPGMPTVTNRPIMRPWGFASRAPKGTIQVVARQGEHFGNRVVLGHRANDIPTDLAEGEAILYDSTGRQIRVKDGVIKVGSPNSAENLVLGKVFQTMMSTVLQALADHVHITSAPGFPTSKPTNANVFSDQKASPVDDNKVLSDISFTEKGGA